ncbi:MAG: VanW family protein [Candidatus Nanopelagicales bacterium]
MSEPTTPPAGDPASSTEEPRRKGRGRVLALGIGGVVLAGYVAAVAAVSGDVPDGTSVLGVDIGGMSTEQAAATLEEELGDAAEEPFPVTAGKQSMEIDPVESGLAVDWEATAGQASGLILNPVDVVRHLTGSVELPPVTTADELELTASLESLALVADVAAEEPTITYSAKAVATLTPGSDGSALDVARATEAVADEYFQVPQAVIDLPMTTTTPTVPADEAQRVFAEYAQPAVALPVTLTVEKKKVVVAPTDISAALSFAAKDETLEPTVDGAVLHKKLADDLDSLEKPGRDATVVIEDDEPVVVPAKKGTAVTAADLAAAVEPVLPETTATKRVASVSVSTVEPAFTTADAKALNIKEKLSSFRQAFEPAAYRYINVGTAAKYLNGTILKPGDVFSMNDTVHERTVANGYTQGTIISNGAFKEELGGGVSIITTATWTAGFYAGLDRIEQHPHSLYISRYKAGLEATVAWGLKDLRMGNDTGNGVLITAKRFTNGVLIEMWGTKKYDMVTSTFTPRHSYTDYETIYNESDTCLPSSGSPGFSISVTRRLITDGKAQVTETWPTTYKPTPNVICGPKPAKEAAKD